MVFLDVLVVALETVTVSKMLKVMQQKLTYSLLR